MLPDWLVSGARRMAGWLETVPWLPACIKGLLREVFTDLLTLAAVNFGLTFCVLAAWDVVKEGHGFNAVSFGTGAAAIMTAWKVLADLGARRDSDPKQGA